MTMGPGLRKFAFMTHVTCSLGWLGSVVAYLALALAGLTAQDLSLARSSYLSMELVGWFVIVPLSLSALLSGLVQSLGTDWGLFRHYWISTKFFLASIGSIILLTHMKAVSHMSGIARTTTLSGGDFGGLRLQLVVHAVGGLLILVAATALSFYKPWGMTPHGRRKQEERSGTARMAPAEASPALRRGFYALIVLVGLAILALALHHLAGGGPRHH